MMYAKRNRRSIRLKNYNYSNPGKYFITICVHNRECLFGHIEKGQMNLNSAGKMIDTWWKRMFISYPGIRTDTYIIMPNHIHGIIYIVAPIETTQYGDPNNKPQKHKTIGDIIGWFKTKTTNQYINCVRNNNWPRFDKRLWQRNYYEHIIRSGATLKQLRQYIENNPLTWIQDSLYHA